MEANNSDDDYEGILKPAFDVVFSPDFDPTSVPKDGNEYLQQVIYERSKCPKIVTAEIPKEDTTTTRRKLLEETREKSSLAPSQEWQLKKMKDFAEFSNYILTSMGYDRSYITFHEKQFMNNLQTEVPVFSKFCLLSQRTKIRIIELLTEKMKSLEPGMNIDNHTGLWIFSLLAALDVPMGGSDTFSLRELARACIRIRSNLSGEVDQGSLTALNMFICIVGRHYRQFDLIDN